MRSLLLALPVLLAASPAHAESRTHVHVAASALAFHASGHEGNSIDNPTLDYTSGGADLSLAIDHRILGPIALQLTAFVGVSAPVLMDGHSTGLGLEYVFR
jgi:hypothetical protein